MTSYGYIIMVVVDACMIWFDFDFIMQLKNHIILLPMFVAEKVLLLLVISPTVQMIAWSRPGDRPLSESMMVSLPMYICTRPQRVNNRIQ